jgi:amino acid transporter
VILAVSYQQTINAYPSGAGGYIVAADNLGPLMGVTAASALLIDYTLDVAVSIATGVQSLTSALPMLAPGKVWLGLGALALITLANLRGIRASGRWLSAPVYVYILSGLGLLAFGVVLWLRGALPPYTPPAGAAESAGQTGEALGVLLILRAFASGAVALTGVEAISNGLPYLKEPETGMGKRTLIVMAVAFAGLFLGLAFLAGQLGVVADPTEVETVVSQVTRTLVGQGPLYLVVQGSAILLLILAANTGFADFPRLLALLARDNYLPTAFAARGSRLSFSNGIVLVAFIAAGLIVAFQGSVAGLVPLFTVGAFGTFTLSQAGMVRHWWRHREGGWHWRMAVNTIGAATTAVVLGVVLVGKFAEGAWIVVLVLPLLVWIVRAVGRHQQRLAQRVKLDPTEARRWVRALPTRRQHYVLVPLGDIDRVALNAVAYARTVVSTDPVAEIPPVVQAVHVTDDRDAGERLRQDWTTLQLDVPLVVLESPYRATTEALLAYLALLEQLGPERTTVTVVLPETLPFRWWHPLLRNYLAWRLKWALLFRPNTVVVSVPLRVPD